MTCDLVQWTIILYISRIHTSLFYSIHDTSHNEQIILSINHCFWCYNTKFDNTIICYISFAQWGDTIFSMLTFMLQRTTLKLDQRDTMADDLINLLLAFLWCYTTVPPLVPKDCRYRCITSLWYISLFCCSYLYGMQLCWFFFYRFFHCWYWIGHVYIKIKCLRIN